MVQRSLQKPFRADFLKVASELADSEVMQGLSEAYQGLPRRMAGMAGSMPTHQFSNLIAPFSYNHALGSLPPYTVHSSVAMWRFLNVSTAFHARPNSRS